MDDPVSVFVKLGNGYRSSVLVIYIFRIACHASVGIIGHGDCFHMVSFFIILIFFRESRTSLNIVQAVFFIYNITPSAFKNYNAESDCAC